MSPHSHSLAERLATPARGLGCANWIAAEAVHSPQLVVELIAAVREERRVVSTRAANALKKLQAERPDLLHPHSHELLLAALACEHLQARWNLTLVLGGLPLRGRDRALAVDFFFEALASPSGFLRAFALRGLVKFAQADPSLRSRVQPALDRAIVDPSPAMRARARKLLPLLTASPKR